MTIELNWQIAQFLSTLPARGATACVWLISLDLIISIHAPREGSDLFLGRGIPLPKISIHAPREGSDEAAAEVLLCREQFLSTLPARGATDGYRRN